MKGERIFDILNGQEEERRGGEIIHVHTSNTWTDTATITYQHDRHHHRCIIIDHHSASSSSKSLFCLRFFDRDKLPLLKSVLLKFSSRWWRWRRKRRISIMYRCTNSPASYVDLSPFSYTWYASLSSFLHRLLVKSLLTLERVLHYLSILILFSLPYVYSIPQRHWLPILVSQLWFCNTLTRTN